MLRCSQRDRRSTARSLRGDVKELLARQLLDAVVHGPSDDAALIDDGVSASTVRLTRLAALKYDEYEGYSPAVKFLESLATWLAQFSEDDRSVALHFVLDRLIFVSSAEMDHLVGTVYPDLLRPFFLRKTAQSTGVSRTRVASLANSKTFQEIQRRTLVMGMSDGARLNKFRRSSALSTEQFHLVSVLDEEKQADIKDKLQRALTKFGSESPATFSTVLVVDDFTASGTTMLRPTRDESDQIIDGVWEGKLVRLKDHLNKLKEAEVVAVDAEVIVLIYLMTEKARDALRDRMQRSGLEREFELKAVHTFGSDVPLAESGDRHFLNLFARYFQDAWVDEHNKKAGHPRYGFGDSRLPLILHHNAPNNTPPVIWKESYDEPEWTGVFPRHERHSSERP